MSLHSPLFLLLLLPIAALVVAYVLAQRRRSTYAVRFATLPMLERLVPKRPAWRRHVPATLLLAAFALLALAAARPEVNVKVPRQQATVIVAVDVSLSMAAKDVDPDRLDAARTAAQGFIEGLPAGFNVGVVSFSGTVDVLSTPTSDHQVAIASLSSLNLGEGTAIGDGVLSSLAQITDLGKQLGTTRVPAEIVLLSDGTNTVGHSLENAEAAATAAGVPVSTIAYGTPEGTVTVQGQTVNVPVDTAALAQLASSTDGTSYTAQSASQLDDVYNDIRSSIGFTTEPREITSWVLAFALLVGLLAAAGSLLWFSRLP